MHKIGFLVAVEVAALKIKYPQLKQIESTPFVIYQADDFLFIESRAGQIRAAAAVQYLIDHYHITTLINFGVVGSLRSDLRLNELCVVKEVVHYDFDVSSVDNTPVGQYELFASPYMKTTAELVAKCIAKRPDINVVCCASGDKFIDSASQKKQLNQQFKADICEMEAAAIVLVCHLNNIDTLLIKAISDSLAGGNQEFKANLLQAALVALDFIDDILCDK